MPSVQSTATMTDAAPSGGERRRATIRQTAAHRRPPTKQRPPRRPRPRRPMQNQKPQNRKPKLRPPKPSQRRPIRGQQAGRARRRGDGWRRCRQGRCVRNRQHQGRRDRRKEARGQGGRGQAAGQQARSGEISRKAGRCRQNNSNTDNRKCNPSGFRCEEGPGPPGRSRKAGGRKSRPGVGGAQAHRPDRGVHQPQGFEALCAAEFRAAVRRTRDDRAERPAAGDACVHGGGRQERRQCRALVGGLAARAPSCRAA